MTLITGLSIGLVGLVAFFSYLGWRLRTASFRDDEQLFLARTAEVFFYCLATLTAVTHLFVIMQSSLEAATSYAPVVRTLFIILFILIGIISSLGSIGIGIYLVLRMVGQVIGLTQKRRDARRRY